jgi:ribosome-associated heat shock protein Hsp15
VGVKQRERDNASANQDAEQSQRLDKWLWHTRFFKSRSQATDAVAGGRVHVNGERVKPSRDVKLGDRLEITREEIRFEVIVSGMPVRRGPATESRQFYEETQASTQQREQRREQQRYAPPAPTGKPDKHARRALRGLKGF